MRNPTGAKRQSGERLRILKQTYNDSENQKQEEKMGELARITGQFRGVKEGRRGREGGRKELFQLSRLHTFSLTSIHFNVLYVCVLSVVGKEKAKKGREKQTIVGRNRCDSIPGTKNRRLKSKSIQTKQ